VKKRYWLIFLKNLLEHTEQIFTESYNINQSGIEMILHFQVEK